ncbi:MAG: hypothetical protein JSR37_01540 [Verrucomicrobia bacterium]|nr:hypothetical protein [Verrucomicrobiota bacterium]MBS0636628.1 hypothetical protein [Verrucomicrobiota bacterium]
MNALCSDNAKTIYKAVAINTVVAGFWAGAVYLEFTDTVLINKMTTAFARCAAENITCAVGCNVTDWQQFTAQRQLPHGLPIASTIIMPLLGSAVGAATRYAYTKVRNIQIHIPQECCTAKKVATAGVALAAATLFPASIYFENQHLSIANMVTSAVSHCDPAGKICDALNWCGILNQQGHFPLQSLISTAVMTPLGWLAGYLGSDGLRAACNAKGRHEYRPVPNNQPFVSAELVDSTIHEDV